MHRVVRDWWLQVQVCALCKLFFFVYCLAFEKNRFVTLLPKKEKKLQVEIDSVEIWAPPNMQATMSIYEKNKRNNKTHTINDWLTLGCLRPFILEKVNRLILYFITVTIGVWMEWSECRQLLRLCKQKMHMCGTLRSFEMLHGAMTHQLINVSSYEWLSTEMKTKPSGRHPE